MILMFRMSYYLQPLWRHFHTYHLHLIGPTTSARFAFVNQTRSFINRVNRCAAAQKKADPQSLGFSLSGLLNSLNLINLNVLERLTGSVPIHSSWVAAAFAWTLCKLYDLNVLHELLFATPMAPFPHLSCSSYRSNDTGSVCFRKSNTIIHKSSKSLRCRAKES